jgi:hypothetical protein
VDIISLTSIRTYLKLHQKRLKAGDKLPSITAIADLAGIHRDTLYALISGERISIRSQYAISKALSLVAKEKEGRSSRLLSVKLNSSGAQIYFGIQDKSLFK